MLKHPPACKTSNLKNWIKLSLIRSEMEETFDSRHVICVWGLWPTVGHCVSVRPLPGIAHRFNLSSKVRNWEEPAGDPNPGFSGLLRLLWPQNNLNSNRFPICIDHELWNLLYANEIWQQYSIWYMFSLNLSFLKSAYTLSLPLDYLLLIQLCPKQNSITKK